MASLATTLFGAIAAVSTPAHARAQTPKATVEVSARTREGAPIPGVAIDFAPIDGPRRSATTDSLGLATITGVEPGSARVTTRKIGFQPGELRAGVGPGRNTIPILLDAVAMPILAAVRIVGDREVMARHQDFETRLLLRQATAAFTAADITKRNPVDAWQMLTTVSAMKVMPYGAGVFAMSNRGKRSIMPPGRTDPMLAPCWMRVMIDGVALPDSMPDLGMLPKPSEIHGMEVFAGPASIPVMYNSAMGGGGGTFGNNMCGLVAVWTR